MKTNRLLLSLFLLSLVFNALSAQTVPASPKREFRGAWIQIINGQFQGMDRDAMQSNLTHQLDELQRCGVNTIIFQVRGEADALYQSPYEPWSRFLTGTQGRAPQPYWDPLAWMTAECHRRGMELHAWINPFRAKTKGTKENASTHYLARHPERCFYYDDLAIIDPGLPENREYICRIAADIVRRYDVDGLHIDDYFYPYPAAGKVIPDDATFARYSNGLTDRGDWRRQNVNRFMQMLHDSIHVVKPWVKFGVSPFGIYHNARQGDNLPGSRTSGLQNYDDLYADVLLWVNNGWVDYNVPQLYWEIGNRAADYKTLITWWNKHASARPLYIGEDIERTAKYADPDNPKSHQLPAKHRLHQQMPNVKGTALWYAKTAADNVGNIGHTLRDYYWRTPALPPLMPFLDDKAPKKVKGLKLVWTENGPQLTWKAPKGKKWGDVANRYVIYRFEKGEKVDLSNASSILKVTYDESFQLPYVKDKRFTYLVTALDRVGNESKGKKKAVSF